MELFYDGHVGGWGYSSGVEHLTADQEVPGSNPGAPCLFFFFSFYLQWKLYLLLIQRPSFLCV